MTTVTGFARTVVGDSEDLLVRRTASNSISSVMRLMSESNTAKRPHDLN